MKKLLNIFIVAGIVTSTISCKKKLTDLNDNPKQTSKVPTSTIFTFAEKSIADMEATPSQAVNPLRLFSQYWTETTYIDESVYNIEMRKISDAIFLRSYASALGNLKEYQRVVDLETNIESSAVEKKNKKAIADILSVYVFQNLVDIFGNVPYSESLDPQKLQPKYDDAKSIYGNLFSRLDAAISNLDASSGSLGAADVIYKGDVKAWKLFANSLKLKMAINIADVGDLDPQGKAQSAVTAGVFTSGANSGKFLYLSGSPNYNPLYDIVASQRQDYVAANTIVNFMNDLNDPRRSRYFDENLGTGVFKGGIYGAGNSYAAFTHPGLYIANPNFPSTLIGYTEILFYLSEAAERGWSVGGTAEQFYNAGITASLTEWGCTSAEVITYLANPDVAYATAKGSNKEKIGFQSWLASYNRGLLGWTTWRRLDTPVLNPPPSMNKSDIPVRYNYPIDEQTVNGSSYKAAAIAIGGDRKSTKLFWDKN